MKLISVVANKQQTTNNKRSESAFVVTTHLQEAARVPSGKLFLVLFRQRSEKTHSHSSQSLCDDITEERSVLNAIGVKDIRHPDTANGNPHTYLARRHRQLRM
jgi:hypothetical protein